MLNSAVKLIAAVLISCSAVYPQSAVKILEIPTLNAFRLLVATDFHCDNQDANDLLTFSNLKKIIANYHPDLMIVNGDLVTDYMPNRLPWVADQIAALKVPWVFARGNHDYPDVQPQDFSISHNYLTKTAYSLHAGTNAYPHYRVEIRNKGETRPIWNLLIIDDAWPTKGFQQAQINWVNSETARIGANPPPAFAFFHIPLPQHLDVWNNGALWGVKGDNVDYEAGVRAAFTAFVNSGMVKGMWCGHDHRNNYYGMLNNIFVAFAQSTGISGYGTAQIKKGATLITVNAAAKTFTTKSVYGDDAVDVTEWRHPARTSHNPELRWQGNLLKAGPNAVLRDFILYDPLGRTVCQRAEVCNALALSLPAGMYEAAFKSDGRVVRLSLFKQQ